MSIDFSYVPNRFGATGAELLEQAVKGGIAGTCRSSIRPTFSRSLFSVDYESEC